MLRHVALVITDNSEERIASITRVRRSDELGTKLAVTISISLQGASVAIYNVVPILLNLSTLMMDAIFSYESSVLTRPHFLISQKTTLFTIIDRTKYPKMMSPPLGLNVCLLNWYTAISEFFQVPGVHIYRMCVSF
jgi:ABC-type uncharacterized transport system permease subunit